MTPTPPQQIPDTSFRSLWFLWILAILWSAIALLVMAMNPQLAGNPILIAFACVGGLLLPFAACLSLRSRKYGRSILALSLPAAPGGYVAGMIHLPKPLVYRAPIHLRLVCIQETGTENSPLVVWQEQLALGRISPDTEVARIPVLFHLPADASPTQGGAISRRTSWALDVTAKARGGPYGASFRIPVLPATAAELTDTPPAILHQLANTIATLKAESTRRYMRYTLLPEGGCRVELLPSRNLIPAVIAGVLGLLFCAGGGAALFAASVHPADVLPDSLIGYGFGGTGAIMLLVAVRFFLIKTTITARNGAITAENSIGLTTRRREIPATEITDFTIRTQGQVQNTPVYSISAARTYGKPIKLCGMLYDHADADWLAAQFKKELGIHSESTAPQAADERR